MTGSVKYFIRHPLSVTFGVGFAICQTVAFNAKVLRQKFHYATHDVASFSPPATPAPHWQDLVFGDGRAVKLLERLEGIAHVGTHDQKILMERSGGLDILPENKELVKYGLNDGRIDAMIDNLWYNIKAIEELEGKNKLPDLVIIDPVKGFVDTDTRQPISEWSYLAFSQAVVHAELSASYHDVRTAADFDDPVRQVNQVTVIEKAVMSWAVLDVLPVIPRMVRDYVATVREDGALALVRSDNKIRRYAGHNPEFYMALRRDYKGTLPTYDVQMAATEKGPEFIP